MSGFWTWPEGAQKAAEQTLKAQLDDVLEEVIADREERRDLRSNVVGDVMRALAPFVTKLVQAQDHEAYARGLADGKRGVQS